MHRNPYPPPHLKYCKPISSRNISFDYIRIIACMMVVFMHAPVPKEDFSTFDSYFLSTLSYVTSPCIGLFFMISGALTLNDKVDNLKRFITKRFSRIVIPTLIWTGIYIGYNSITSNASLSDILISICSIPFGPQANGALWYIYVLVGLYFLIPILGKWIQSASASQIGFYLILWGITLVYPYLELFIPINTSDTGVLYYFSGYVGYFILGYFLTHKIGQVIGWYAIILSMVMCLVIPIPLKLIGIQIDFYRLFWYTSLPVAVMCAVWFLLCDKIPKPKADGKATTLIVKISSLTFGIYLSHILFRNVIFNLTIFHQMPTVVSTTLSAICLLVCSIILCYVIKQLPFSKYIIGI